MRKQENGSANDTATLSQCAIDGHWCCGDLSSEACCALDNRFFLAANVGASSSTSRTFLRSTSSTVNQRTTSQSTFSLGLTSISSSTPISTTTSKPSGSHSQIGKSAGLGAGIGIGVLAVGILIFWLVVRRQRRLQARQNQYQRPVKQEHDMAYGMPKHGSNGTQLAELENESTFVTPEIDGAATHEMDGASSHVWPVNGFR